MRLLPSSERRSRYRTVATVLARHGMGALNVRLGLTRFVPFHRQLFDQSQAGPGVTMAEHARMALEELGTTGIKFGQILSTRPDLLPPEFIAEFEKLRDQVPPVPAEAIIARIESELRRPLSDIFSEFDEVPLAAASIGQVHAATLRDGSRVVVKVRKPRITETVNIDLGILADLAERATRAELLGRHYDLIGVVDDFGWTLRAELDYVREGRHADLLREALSEDGRVVVPAVRWPLTTSSVLVLERIDGIAITDVAALTAAGISRRAVARTSADILMKQVFEDGFYHADPHGGNFLVTTDGRLALLDFGMVGELEEDVHDTLLHLLSAIVRQDAEGATDALEGLGVVRSATVRDAVRRDIRHLLSRYYGLTLSEFNLREFLEDMLSVVRRHGLQLPTELALVLKTLAMSESLWIALDPSFNPVRIAERYVERSAEQLYSPRRWGKRAIRAGADAAQLGVRLPGQIRRLLSRIDRGEFEVVLQHRELEDMLNRLSAMVTRLSTAIVTAAFIMGLPFLANVYQPPGWRYVAPAWFFGGIIIITALLVRLIVAGRRRRRE